MGITVIKKDGGAGSATTSASDLTSGTLDNARLDSGQDVSNLADGSVSDTEFQYLNGVTSAIQTQIDNAGGGGTVQDASTKAIKVATEVGTTGNARGTNAVDLQVSRSSATQVASGDYSFNIGRDCTTSGDYSTASGFDTTASAFASTAGGNESIASGIYSLAKGRECTASGDYSTAIGRDCTASGDYSFNIGMDCTASGDYSTASGNESTSYLTGQFSNSGDKIILSGDSQYSRLVVRERTTDATPKVMTLGADGTLTRMVIPSDKAWRYNIELIGVESATGDTYSITHVGTIKRDGSTTSLVGTDSTQNENSDAGASGWSSAVTADDTNESLKIEVTGEASHTINWCATVHLTEVGF